MTVVTAALRLALLLLGWTLVALPLVAWAIGE